MLDPRKNSAHRAQSVLDAWGQGDLGGLDAELAGIEHATAIETRADEQERLDLLDGVAAQMRDYLVGAIRGAEYAETCVRLVEHLAASGPHAAIRSEKLSFFPCSRSVRRISACH
jgi:hypothetical protein